jgi:hypothetical protein
MSGERILIFRPDNIGDVLLFTGALQHIRNLHPNAHITLAVQKHIVNLVELCPYINTCVPIGDLKWCAKFEQKDFPLKSIIVQATHFVNKIWNVINKPFDIIIYPVKSPQESHLEVIDILNATQKFGIIGCGLNASKNGYHPKLKPITLFTNYLDIHEADSWTHELITTLNFLRFIGCDVTTIDEIKPQFWLS